MVERIAFIQSPRWRLSFSEWAWVKIDGIEAQAGRGPSTTAVRAKPAPATRHLPGDGVTREPAAAYASPSAEFAKF
jgi:hypothetical protein